MKKNWLFFIFLFCSCIFLSAQRPIIHCLSVNYEGQVTLTWENIPNTIHGKLIYTNEYLQIYNTIKIFDGDTTTSFTHNTAGGNFQHNWYYIVNYTATDSVVSDIFSPYFLRSASLDDVAIQLTWNPILEGNNDSVIVYRKQDDEWSEIGRTNDTTFIDSTNQCIELFKYQIFSITEDCHQSNICLQLTDDDQPIAPTFDSVSIINNQYPILGWQRSPSVDCAGYRIYKRQDNGTGWDLLMEIPHQDSLWAIDSSFSDVCSMERIYCVIAVDRCGNTSPFNEVKPLHNLVLHPPILDTCRKTIELSWLPLGMYDLAPQLGGYRIWYSQNGGPFQLDNSALPNAVSYSFNHPERNSHYVFKIQAFNNLETITVSSCEYSVFAALPKEPEFGFIRYASVQESRIHLCFEIDTQASSPTYALLRSTTGEEESFQTIKTLAATDSSLLFTIDSSVDVQHYSYFYRLHSIDSCSHILESPLIVSSILLQISTNTQSQVQLDWTPYNGFIDSLQTYKIYRKIDDQPFTFLTETQETSFADISDSSGIYTKSLQYCISAISSGDNHDTAWSNQVTYLQKSFSVFFPNAFRPNGSINNIFRPIFSGIEVKDLQFIIYNRWGEPIFSTTEQGEGWNGKNAQQHECPAGTYVYYFLMTDQSGSRYQKTGYVILLQ
ncbi:MAG: gliding motility-associated C-terminal domain-containing protein [Bacteroidales bacterium]|nr:gliding motility-associated C-terminal domain-containing protein [Bacteroidales bacterium]